MDHIFQKKLVTKNVLKWQVWESNLQPHNLCRVSHATSSLFTIIYTMYIVCLQLTHTYLSLLQQRCLIWKKSITEIGGGVNPSEERLQSWARCSIATLDRFFDD